MLYSPFYPLDRPEKKKRIGAADPNWPDWCAGYKVREHAGEELPQ